MFQKKNVAARGGQHFDPRFLTSPVLSFDQLFRPDEFGRITQGIKESEERQHAQIFQMFKVYDVVIIENKYQVQVVADFNLGTAA